MKPRQLVVRPNKPRKSQKICPTNFAVIVVLAMLMALVVPTAQAEPPLDVRLVIDISGSMAEADPGNRRADALSMFIRVLPATAYAGVWTFGGQVNQLVQHDLAGPLWKNIALTRTANLPAHALRSNLPEALQQASWDWEQPAVTGPRHILLLTDGAVDVSDSAEINAQASERLLGELAPRLVKANIRLHVLAMADAPGAQLLSQLAAATGGMALEGITPDQLLSQFMAAIDSVAGASEVPLNKVGSGADVDLGVIGPGTIDPGTTDLGTDPGIIDTDTTAATLRASARRILSAEAAPVVGPVALAQASDRVFRIDAGIGSVDLLWLADARAQLRLTDPKGQKYTRASLPERGRWHVGRGFELVSIDTPSPGLWRLAQVAGVAPASAQAPQARMLAYADLQLQLLDARGALAPQALQSVDAQLSNGQGQAIIDTDFLDQIEVHAYLDTARSTEVVMVEPGAKAGQYRATLPALVDVDAGVLRFEAVSATFARGVRMPFQVRSPVQLELHPQGRGALGWVKVGLDGLAPDSLVIAAKVRQPPAPAHWVPALKQPGGIWKLSLEERAGSVEIELDVQGKYLSQKNFSFRGEMLKLTFPLAAMQSFKLDESGRQIQPAEPVLPAVTEPTVPSTAALIDPIPAAISSTISTTIPTTTAASDIAPALVIASESEAKVIEQPMLPLWFVGLVSLMNLGVCGALGWLLRPSAASRDVLAQLQAAMTDDPDPQAA